MIDFSKYISPHVFDGIRILSPERAEQIKRRFGTVKEDSSKKNECNKEKNEGNT